jgi:uncharacterized membrane protein
MTSSYKESTKKIEVPPSVEERSESLSSHALTLSLISISAALYAVAIAVTSPIPTPWGVGHFRPGVVIPAFFSVVFGPIVGGVGAAIGCFLGDFALSFFGLTTPLLSLIAGVPGNLVGFYLLGWLVSRRRSMASFILSNFAALIAGNLIAALGVLMYFWFVVPDWALWPVDMKIAAVVGLALFWVATMVVFVVPLVPLLVTYVEPTLNRIGVRGVSNLSWNSRASLVKSSILVALILTVIYVLLVFVPGGSLLFGEFVPPELLLLASAVVLCSGVAFAVFVGKLGRVSTGDSL